MEPVAPSPAADGVSDPSAESKAIAPPISSPGEFATAATAERVFSPKCFGGCGLRIESAKWKMPMNVPGAAAGSPTDWRCGPCNTKHMRDLKAAKRKTMPRSVHSIEEIDAALTKHGGHRPNAAQELGITVNQLRCRLHDNPLLGRKWSREEMNNRAVQAEREKLGLVAPVTLAALEVSKGTFMQVQNELLNRLNKLLIRMDKIENRLDKGEEAKETQDAEFRQKHAFLVNVRGDLVEERLLRESLDRQLDNQVKITREFRGMLEMFHAMEQDKNRETRSIGPRKAKAAWVSKGAMMETNGSTA